MHEAPLFSVPLADLDYGEREIDEEIPREWLRRALQGSEAVPRDKPGRLTVTVSKSGREVMVRGRARAYVTMPCARTLDPVDYDLAPDIFLLLGPPSGPGPRPAAKAASAKAQKAAKRPVKDAPKGKSGPRDRRKREEDAMLPEEEAAKDTYEGDRVNLDPFVREFLLLELPMVPLREDLRSEESPAIERPLVPAPKDRQAQEAIDPRLAPLADIASRLRAKKE
ncbi:MAG TPA: DUF177 domain-containing protein [Polyangiaceae bacterium]|nr:DUF177 domain-containing protein [Polyangiaceae bacterium]